MIVVDATLATGNTAVAAFDRLKEHGATDLRVVLLFATQVGIATLVKNHPEVRIWIAAIDPVLNERGYIVPGLGDTGDRLYGTR